MKKLILFPNQRVITAAGDVVTVAFVSHGQVYGYGRNGLPVPIVVKTDAWGSEHDQTIGLEQSAA